MTAPASTSAKAAQQLLEKNKKGRLPLVNDKGQLVSVESRVYSSKERVGLARRHVESAVRSA